MSTKNRVSVKRNWEKLKEHIDNTIKDISGITTTPPIKRRKMVDGPTLQKLANYQQFQQIMENLEKEATPPQSEENTENSKKTEENLTM